MTDRRTLANRTNASKSTGPKSAIGKAIVGQNAIAHGLRSQRLILNDEDPTLFINLRSDLYDALQPVGAVELALAERIATAIWRQRRIEQAEAAALNIQRRREEIVEELERLRGHSERSAVTNKSLPDIDAD